MLRDLSKQKTYYLDYTASAIDDTHLRMDLRGTLGIYGGSLIIKNNEVAIISALDKKVFIGKRSPELVEKLIKIPINPEDLFSIFFVKHLNANRWTCHGAKEQETCTSVQGEMQLTRGIDKNSSWYCDLTSTQGKVSFKMNLIKTKVQDKNKQYQAKPPEGFKVYRL